MSAPEETEYDVALREAVEAREHLLITAKQLILFYMAGWIGANIYLLNPDVEHPCPVLALCYHEASHCLLRGRQGTSATRVEVSPTSGSGCASFGDSSPASRATLATDDEKIESILNVCGRPPELNLEILEKETKSLLLDNWGAITRLAQALYNRTTGGETAVLNESEIDRLSWTPEQWMEAYGISENF